MCVHSVCVCVCGCVCVSEQMCVYTMSVRLWGGGGGGIRVYATIIGMIIRTVHVWVGVYN